MTRGDAGATKDDLGGLPDPETVVAEASERDPSDSDEGARSADAAVNLAVPGQVDALGVDLTADGYEGEAAGAVGRLAAAVDAVAPEGDLAIHYPEPDFTAEGPWLVLAPLSGFVSTVSKGVGRAVVELDYDGTADPALDDLDDRVSRLLDAVRPRHDHYPVADDERGAFTTGMTTFAVDELSVDDGLTATFAVSTTPATRPSEVEARFADVAGVERVRYEPVAGVERAAPGPKLREAVEAAHREVRGQCDYEWLPDPGVFAEIPDAAKMALGTGTPGARAFSREQYETCVDLLEATCSNLGVSA